MPYKVIFKFLTNFVIYRECIVSCSAVVWASACTDLSLSCLCRLVNLKNISLPLLCSQIVPGHIGEAASFKTKDVINEMPGQSSSGVKING